MATQVSVMNNSLRLMGEPQVSEYNSSGKYARRIRNAWNEAVDLAFEEHAWKRFSTMEILSAVAGTPFGWEYQFALPGKFVRMFKVTNDPHPDATPIDYEIRDGMILTNSETSYVRFVSGTYKTQLGGWPQAFAGYVAAILAEQSYPATDESNSVRDRIEKALMKRKKNAKALDRSLNPVQKIPPSEMVTARTRGIRSSRTGGGY